MIRRILVIDDDPMNLRMAEYFLRQESYKVLLASSGPEGIGLIKDGKIDLVLLDIEMPGMDGMKTLEHIRMDKRFADLPVIFLTASADKRDVLSASRLGAVDYVTKPFVPQDLLKRVNRVFEEEHS